MYRDMTIWMIASVHVLFSMAEQCLRLLGEVVCASTKLDYTSKEMEQKTTPNVMVRVQSVKAPVIYKNFEFSGTLPAFDLLNYLIGADISFSDLRTFYEATVWPHPLGVLVVGRWYDKQSDSLVISVISGDTATSCFVSLYSGILLDFCFCCLQRKNKDKLSLDLVMLTRPHKEKIRNVQKVPDVYLRKTTMLVILVLPPLRSNVEFVGMRSEHQETRCLFQLYYDTTMIKFAWQLFEVLMFDVSLYLQYITSSNPSHTYDCIWFS